MKTWAAKAIEMLRASLAPPRTEINELDWKMELSRDKKRLTEHLSAFANYPGGGFLVFGVNPSGELHGISEQPAQAAVLQLANLGRGAVDPPIVVDHTIEDYDGARLLFVYIAESEVKPVHLRGKMLDQAFIRSGGTTRRASRQEIGTMMLQSRTPRWEELHASVLLPDDELISLLNTEAVLKLVEKPPPTSSAEMLDWLSAERFISREPSGGGYVTNLGAIAAARDISRFPDISRKAVRVVLYDGMNKSKTKLEQEGMRGYAVSFQSLLRYVMSLLPQSEAIEHALRVRRTLYPEIALREIIANALIHQDFSIGGVSPLIEIFDNRIEMSNPGSLLPSKRLDRIIGTQPESRNEQLARSFRRYKICEERGSGLAKAALEVERNGLPPIQFHNGPNYFKVTLYRPRAFRAMSPGERLDACYQHAVLKHWANDAMTNQSFRERLKLPKTYTVPISGIIRQAVAKGRIRLVDPNIKSKRYSRYWPYWA